jgi:putative hydrolase of the HAD superfamily
MTAVLVFDLDDTLYLERDFVRSGFRAVDRWLASRDMVEGFFEVAWQLFEAGRRGDVFDCTLERLGMSLEAELIRRLVDVYRSHAPAIALDPEAAGLLARLHARGPLALLTDGYRATQERKVAALGLERYCSPIVYTDALGREHWKPSPRGFLSIQQRFGGQANRFVYIGDNPAKDFRAPNALGWLTIRLRHPRGEHARAEAQGALDAAAHTITHLAEIEENPLLELPD